MHNNSVNHTMLSTQSMPTMSTSMTEFHSSSSQPFNAYGSGQDTRPPSDSDDSDDDMPATLGSGNNMPPHPHPSQRMNHESSSPALAMRPIRDPSELTHLSNNTPYSQDAYNSGPSNEPASPQPDKPGPETWSCEQIADWIEGLGARYEAYKQKAVDAGLDGYILQEMLEANQFDEISEILELEKRLAIVFKLKITKLFGLNKART